MTVAAGRVFVRIGNSWPSSDSKLSPRSVDIDSYKGGIRLNWAMVEFLTKLRLDWLFLTARKQAGMPTHGEP